MSYDKIKHNLSNLRHPAMMEDTFCDRHNKWSSSQKYFHVKRASGEYFHLKGFFH